MRDMNNHRINVTYKTPDGTEAWEATLLYDDGEYPNACEETVGYFTHPESAVEAMRAALAEKPTLIWEKDGDHVGWNGCVERGHFRKNADDEWFMEPSFESADHDNYVSLVYRHDMKETMS